MQVYQGYFNVRTTGCYDLQYVFLDKKKIYATFIYITWIFHPINLHACMWHHGLKTLLSQSWFHSFKQVGQVPPLRNPVLSSLDPTFPMGGLTLVGDTYRLLVLLCIMDTRAKAGGLHIARAEGGSWKWRRLNLLGHQRKYVQNRDDELLWDDSMWLYISEDLWTRACTEGVFCGDYQMNMKWSMK